MPAASPLAIVKDKFGSKDKLVEAVVEVLAKETDTPKDELRKRLAATANKKLLRLLAAATKVKEAGGRDKLVAATAEALGKRNDKPFLEKLDGLSVPRLVDLNRVATRK